MSESDALLRFVRRLAVLLLGLRQRSVRDPTFIWASASARADGGPFFVTSLMTFDACRKKNWSAEPPASVSMPSDATALPHARMSGVDRPMSLPAAPERLAMSRIWLSVDAPLLPRSTSVEPNFS
jgi:hypothetical protein